MALPPFLYFSLFSFPFLSKGVSNFHPPSFNLRGGDIFSDSISDTTSSLKLLSHIYSLKTNSRTNAALNHFYCSDTVEQICRVASSCGFERRRVSTKVFIQNPRALARLRGLEMVRDGPWIATATLVSRDEDGPCPTDDVNKTCTNVTS